MLEILGLFAAICTLAAPTIWVGRRVITAIGNKIGFRIVRRSRLAELEARDQALAVIDAAYQAQKSSKADAAKRVG